jgi:hypothetical protein
MEKAALPSSVRTKSDSLPDPINPFQFDFIGSSPYILSAAPSQANMPAKPSQKPKLGRKPKKPLISHTLRGKWTPEVSTTMNNTM